jgi:hypothetical protein
MACLPACLAIMIHRLSGSRLGHHRLSEAIARPPSLICAAQLRERSKGRTIQFFLVLFLMTLPLPLSHTCTTPFTPSRRESTFSSMHLPFICALDDFFFFLRRAHSKHLKHYSHFVLIASSDWCRHSVHVLCVLFYALAFRAVTARVCLDQSRCLLVPVVLWRSPRHGHAHQPDQVVATRHMAQRVAR